MALSSEVQTGCFATDTVAGLAIAKARSTDLADLY